MIEFYTINNTELHIKLKTEVEVLRNHELHVVHLMREADRRRLWAQRGFASFLKYCVVDLKMSEADFYRKKALLETIRDIPEIEEKVANGSITMSAISYAATVFRRETKENGVKRAPQEKREVLERLEGKSCSEVKRELAALNPDLTIYPDKVRHLSKQAIQRTYTSNPKLEAQIQRADEILGHMLPANADHADLLMQVFAIALSAKDPEMKATKLAAKKTQKVLHQEGAAISANQGLPSQQKQSTRCDSAAASPRTKKRRHIRLLIKHKVADRDQHRCTYVDPNTKRRCESRGGLQLDHVVPYAMGGSDNEENLRLYCRAHNQMAAIEMFGAKKMREYVPNLE